MEYESCTCAVVGREILIFGGPNDFHADFDELDFDDMRPEVVDFVQQRLTNEASGTVFDTALECGLKFMEGSLKFRRFGERLAAQSEGAAAAVVYV